MSLDAEEVRKIAHLARLDVCAEDIPEYARNLSNILDLVKQMSELETSNVEPMAHPLDTQQSIRQRLREDKVTEENQRERFQQQAPSVEAGLYLVPKVIE